MLKVKFCSNPAASPPPGVFGSEEVVVFSGLLCVRQSQNKGGGVQRWSSRITATHMNEDSPLRSPGPAEVLTVEPDRVVLFSECAAMEKLFTSEKGGPSQS